MQVYLDSNIIYSDPFFLKLTSKILLWAAKDKVINIYISDVVIKESENNFVSTYNDLSKKFDEIQKNAKNIGVDIDRDRIFAPFNPKTKWNEFIDRLQESKHITILPYNNDWLPELVHRAIYRKKPFKNDGVGFRDCLIWLTYANHVNSTLNPESVFLTNNTNDFYNDAKNDLHPDLKKEIKQLKVFKSIKEFFESFKQLFSSYQNYELQNKIRSVYTSNEIINVIDNKYMEDINAACKYYLAEIDTISIKNDIDVKGYYEFDCVTGITVKDDFVVKAFDQEAELYGILNIEFTGISFLHNSVREKSEDHYLKSNSDKFSIKIDFVLFLDQDALPTGFDAELKEDYEFED
jgi:hypothetical protein